MNFPLPFCQTCCQEAREREEQEEERAAAERRAKLEEAEVRSLEESAKYTSDPGVQGRLIFVQRNPNLGGLDW